LPLIPGLISVGTVARVRLLRSCPFPLVHQEKFRSDDYNETERLLMFLIVMIDRTKAE
jgi:hypothetical protein